MASPGLFAAGPGNLLGVALGGLGRGDGFGSLGAGGGDFLRGLSLDGGFGLCGGPSHFRGAGTPGPGLGFGGGSGCGDPFLEGGAGLRRGRRLRGLNDGVDRGWNHRLNRSGNGFHRQGGHHGEVKLVPELRIHGHPHLAVDGLFRNQRMNEVLPIDDEVGLGHPAKGEDGDPAQVHPDDADRFTRSGIGRHNGRQFGSRDVGLGDHGRHGRRGCRGGRRSGPRLGHRGGLHCGGLHRGLDHRLNHRLDHRLDHRLNHRLDHRLNRRGDGFHRQGRHQVEFTLGPELGVHRHPHRPGDGRFGNQRMNDVLPLEDEVRLGNPSEGEGGDPTQVHPDDADRFTRSGKDRQNGRQFGSRNDGLDDHGGLDRRGRKGRRRPGPRLGRPDGVGENGGLGLWNRGNGRVRLREQAGAARRRFRDHSGSRRLGGRRRRQGRPGGLSPARTATGQGQAQKQAGRTPTQDRAQGRARVREEFVFWSVGHLSLLGVPPG